MTEPDRMHDPALDAGPQGVECNEVAAESAGDAADRRCLREAVLAHLTGKTAGAKTQSTRD